MTIRSILAVLGGFVIFYVLHSMMELMLVQAVAPAPLENINDYLAVRNRPDVALAQFGLVAVAALLDGYMTGKIAGRQELQHAGAGAAVLAVMLYQTFSGEGALPLSWPVQAGLLIVAMAAITAGAYVRGRARMLLQEPASSPTSQPASRPTESDPRSES